MMERSYEEVALMNATEYKKYHESFMENNHGSSAFCTFMRIFFTVQCSLYCSLKCQNIEISPYINEFVFIVFPLISAHTILSNYIYLLNFVVLLMVLYKFFCCYSQLRLQSFKSFNYFKSRKIYSISCMRGLTYLITVFSILAVDFLAFPRYLAKTERYGYSLMDTGVGLFMLMSGLVHKDLNKSNFLVVLKGNAKFISILFILGMARFLSVKKLEYQEHMSEYGVHWNFFFTLAVCKLVSSILLAWCERAFLLSIITLITHEYLLYFKLEDWVFSKTPRNSIIDANREGISSCLGYVSLYLFSVYIKKGLLDKCRYRYEVIFTLVSGAALLWAVSCVVDMYRPTSRTLANAGYCTYLEAILLTVLSVLYFFEVLFQNQDNVFECFELPLILSAVNDNGLIYFLIANLLTGAINMSVRTLLISTSVTYVILSMYMIITILLTLYLKKIGIKI